MLNVTAIALTGFSIFAAFILIAVYVPLYRQLDKSWQSIAAAAVLLLLFAISQAWHLQYFLNREPLVESKLYSTLILLKPPLFLLFFVEYIGVRAKWWVVILPCFVPIILNALFDNTIGFALGFALGSAYAMYCVYRVSALKSERNRFGFEIFCLVFLAVGALVLSVVVALMPAVSEHLFIVSYSTMIGLSFVMLLLTLLLFPDIALNLDETIQTKYAKSTLVNVDEKTELEKLETLLNDDKLSRNEGLNLAMLSEHSGLSNHQISELINTQYGHGVSQFIRRHRVEDAKAMLLAEPSASVLSVGLSVGFTSQSSFYAAFKQEAGMSPGAYRKLKLPE